jgi:hypothetical protein
VGGLQRENSHRKSKRLAQRKHTTDPKTASAAKPVLVIEPLKELLAQLRDSERNPSYAA